MKGARKYANLFTTGQFGRLYIISGKHARGCTFHIQILPEGEEAIPNGGNLCLNKDAVEVYGIISGNPGWTEEYGWLHEGKWQDDFEELVRGRELELEIKDKKHKESQLKRELSEKERIQSLLNSY